jgi:hypothetical protein
MPESSVIARARRDREEGKAPSTQAGEFVREEIEHVRQGVHGARSVKQAIAIGLSKARRAGVKLSLQKKRRASRKIYRKGSRSGRYKKGNVKSPSARRSRATLEALRRESTPSVSRTALSRQAKRSAVKRGSAARHRAAEKAVRTKRKIASHRKH